MSQSHYVLEEKVRGLAEAWNTGLDIEKVPTSGKS